MPDKHRIEQCLSLHDPNLRHLMLEGTVTKEHTLAWQTMPAHQVHYTALAFQGKNKAIGFATVLKKEPEEHFSIHFGFASGHHQPRLALRLARKALYDAQADGVKKVFATVDNRHPHITQALERLGFKAEETSKTMVKYSLNVD